MMMPRWKHIQDLDAPEDVYLSRLMLFKTRWLGIYFHIIRRPDYARCEHDHPWPFVTLILRGGYEEEVRGQRFVRRPGYIGYRGRDFEHRITRLLGVTAWSLVIRGPDRVRWGFRTAIGKVPWQQYVSWDGVKRVLWCADGAIDIHPRIRRDPSIESGENDRNNQQTTNSAPESERAVG
jgi:hypothetical protein